MKQRAPHSGSPLTYIKAAKKIVFAALRLRAKTDQCLKTETENVDGVVFQDINFLQNPY